MLSVEEMTALQVAMREQLEAATDSVASGRMLSAEELAELHAAQRAAVGASEEAVGHSLAEHEPAATSDATPEPEPQGDTQSQRPFSAPVKSV